MSKDFIFVKVFPEKKVESITQKGEKFIINVSPKRKDGLATLRAKELLAKYLGISSKKLILRKGATTQNKLFEIL